MTSICFISSSSGRGLLSFSITVLIPPGRQDEEPAILAQLRRGEQIDHYETIRQRKDGSLVDISLTVSPIKDAAGHIIGASKIAPASPNAGGLRISNRC
jgi:PAS domain S-box-containing protein